MSKIYAMSDIHGCLQSFEDALALVDLSADDTKLVLLGDYIHGQDSYGVLDKIMQLERKYGTDKVIVLRGNHEDMAIDGRWGIGADRFSYGDDDDDGKDDKYIRWMENLRCFYYEGNTIFVHAGIDEEAGDLWQWGTDEYTMTEKYPADIGKFECGDMDIKIVAGHIGTSTISDDPTFHDIYYDGRSHYYIDASTLDTGFINVIMVDTDKDKYYYVTDAGKYIIEPYEN